MADRTAIEWTDATWNPVRGCARVSAGCQHCYAERVAARFAGEGGPYEGLIHPKTGAWNGKVKLVPEALKMPWRWTRPRRIFVNSMSDLFHPDVPFEFIAAVFWVMSVTTRHTYQILTKRPERMLEFFEWTLGQFDEWLEQEPGTAAWLYPPSHPERGYRMADGISHAVDKVPAIKALGWTPANGKRGGYDNCGPGWPYENVWLGVSVENQRTAHERIPLLLQCPAAVRWISAEPLLGPIDLNMVTVGLDERGRTDYDWLRMLDWVVAGGESGPGARPMHPDWARSLRDQCELRGVPFLFKQWGDWRPITEGEGDWYDNLYRSRVAAKDGESQRDLDEAYGRECTVDNVVLQHDGATMPITAAGAWQQGTGALLTFRTGKKAAGRTLDGALHDAYPEKANG